MRKTEHQLRLCLLRNESGAVLIYVSLILPILLTFALLAVDGSRVYNLQTQLQKAVDALALAGAAELDRRPGARLRATNAIVSTVHNRQKFAVGDGTITVTKIRYLHALPPIDSLAIDASYEVTAADEAGDLIARFVEVTLAPATLNTILPAMFVGGTTNTVTMSATAVAGFTAVACKIVPMFICNPFEDLGSTYIFTAGARGRQIKMRQGAKGEQYFPGNFGYLDPEGVDFNGMGGGGTPVLVEALAAVAPPGCYEQNGVNQRTGDPQPAGSAINVRFDLWEAPLQAEATKSFYPPAPNVRRGYPPIKRSSKRYDYCGSLPDANTEKYRLPRDANFGGTYGHLGDGSWASNLGNYWRNNYQEDPSDLLPFPPTWTIAPPKSRYDVYKYELEAKTSNGRSILERGPLMGEKGIPMCYSGSTPFNNPDRRLLYAAIINCGALNVKGGSGDPMPVLAFGRFFVTEPVPPAGEVDGGTVFAEFVDVIQPGTVDNDVARDQVQLYR